jgi:hypothetical protein
MEINMKTCIKIFLAAIIGFVAFHSAKADPIVVYSEESLQQALQTEGNLALRVEKEFASAFLEKLTNMTEVKREDQHRIIELDLSNNDIVELPADCFVCLLNVEFLDISNNSLERLPHNCLHALFKLKALNLRYNRLREFPSWHAVPLYSLEKLDLSYNRLVALNPNTFALCPKIRSVDITGNNINLTQEQLYRLFPGCHSIRDEDQQGHFTIIRRDLQTARPPQQAQRPPQASSSSSNNWRQNPNASAWAPPAQPAAAPAFRPQARAPITTSWYGFNRNR